MTEVYLRSIKKESPTNRVCQLPPDISVASNKTIYLYAGAGYGSRTLSYELDERAEDESGKSLEGIQVKDTSKSPTGVAFELGGILRFNKFLISAGYHTVNAKYHEISAGIGMIF